MRSTISARIADQLRSDIRAGAFSGDGRIPTERELAARFDVARNTVRRAIEDLRADGLVVCHVGRGTFVAGNDGLAQLAPGAQTGAENENAAPGLAYDFVAEISPRDLIEARLMFEPAVAAAAAANATDADIQQLLRAQAGSEETEEMETFERYDAEIHRLLFAMSQNQLVIKIDEMLSAMRANADWLAAKRRAYTPALKARYVSQHKDIIEGIRMRSPKAAREAMTAHLEEVRRALLEI
ncbi:FadR/GntR family transcriptional regulator [Hwanghaeella sp.]|uniref:FadR/GntR family transcriptional regulator n=1 Tax=Hwanghaeella sp. TaxID=2605943 RepID=UPI003CCC14B8